MTSAPKRVRLARDKLIINRPPDGRIQYRQRHAADQKSGVVKTPEFEILAQAFMLGRKRLPILLAILWQGSRVKVEKGDALVSLT